ADMMARLNPSTALFELRDSIEKIDEELFTGSAWSWNQPAYESWQKVMALAGLLLKNPASDSERTLLARQALMYAAPLAEKYRQQFFEKVEDPSPKAAAPDDEIGRFAADRDITRQHMLKAETARLLRAL
ncbi:MAG: hypothetical protein KGK30_08930, partial [Elusimicrobia bacterium]|nr:hypothetical protein [Elusimicrobiota bacterium]